MMVGIIIGIRIVGAIGDQGQTLAELQHLLKAVLRKKTKELFFVDLDINGYKKKKTK